MKDMLKPAILSAVATIASFALAVAAVASVLPFLLSYGLAPCTDESVVLVITRISTPVILFGSALWLGRLKWKPDARALAIALLLPIVAVLLHYQLAERNTAR